MAMKALVLIPTYNESENIERLARAVLAADERVDILVIDDGSPDGTKFIFNSNVFDANQAFYVVARNPEPPRGLTVEIEPDRTAGEPRVRLINRGGKMGLGSAYAEGMKRALADGYEAAVTMDADFSHPADRLPAMLDALSRAGMAVGSRYVEGGGSAGRPFFRRVMSRCANLFARLITATPVRDMTSGFNALTRESLEKIGLTTPSAPGFVFVTELKFRAEKAGVTIKEIPIVFRDREAGGSKITIGEIVAGFLRLLKVRFRP